MKTSVFVRRCQVNAPAEEVFRWHARPGAFERLIPPWEPVQVLERAGGITDGARTVIRIRIGPFRRRWVSEHRDYQEGRQFRDVQVAGPFAHWDHLHRIEPAGPQACTLEDRIEYALPLGPLGRLLGGGMVRRKLDKTFAYRHRTMIADLAAHQAPQDAAVARVLISGATGLVGSALTPFLTSGGHQVARLIRTKPAPGSGDVFWNPMAGVLNPAALEGFEAVVHLAGENIAARRWTARRKARIRDSRIQGTRLLCEMLARLERPPRVLASASAIGYYGSRGDDQLDENSPSGTGFLAEVCRDWEKATEPAAAKGIRVVHLRFGVILSPAGGALAKMLFPFRIGGGGKIGNGRQFMSWIALDDVLGAVHHALLTETLVGPVNVVAPRPVTNYEFTKTLGRILWRPTLVPMPGWLARLLFGEMAKELLLASARVEPRPLRETGYVFRHPEPDEALRHLLGKMTG
jgi:uncharacterized protein (TIGR01777 family)